MTPRQHILEEFPYPVAYPYSLIFDEENASPSTRRWALCFTQYQTMRMIGLPLVSQYLREDIDEENGGSVRALNKAIAALRSPFFSDWITLAFTLRKHLPRLGIEPFYPELNESLSELQKARVCPVGEASESGIPPLNAILKLRNRTAHGGMPDEAEAERNLAEFLPILHQVLDSLGFLASARLEIFCDSSEAILMGYGKVRCLRGVEPPAPVDRELEEFEEDLFEESRAILVHSEDQRALPLYPLFHTVDESEPLFLYDGHFGMRVKGRQGFEERSYIYYLGTHRKSEDSVSCGPLREMLENRNLSFSLKKVDTAPWTLADSMRESSRFTLNEVLGRKYFPDCYVPFAEVEGHFERFMVTPRREHWHDSVEDSVYVNGFILVGNSGSGKTAFLAHQVRKLLEGGEAQKGNQSGEEAERENQNLVLYFRGSGVGLRKLGDEEAPSLFRDVCEKIGVLIEGVATESGKSQGSGFSSFHELFLHLHSLWKEDRVEDRRMILVLDALNEAPQAERVISEALDLMQTASRFPWCKVVFSTRSEWLHIWSDKVGANETSRWEELRHVLYSPPAAEEEWTEADNRDPVIVLDPLSDEHSKEIFQRYRSTDSGEYCQARWESLSRETRDLLRNPLHIHLFMEAYRGDESPAPSGASRLFQKYVQRGINERPGLKTSVDSVIRHLLESLERPSADLSDDEVSVIRRRWAEGFSVGEIPRLELNPLEGLVHEGFLAKRVGDKGGGYRFVFQTVAEYLIYDHLRRGVSDDLSGWKKQAEVPVVFPEYAGAFLFLFRDWTDACRWQDLVQLVEEGAGWLQSEFSTFLAELAWTRSSESNSRTSAFALAHKLARIGGEVCASCLKAAARGLEDSLHASVAATYLEKAVEIWERLWEEKPIEQEIGAKLGDSLMSLGRVRAQLGDTARAREAYERSLEIREALWSEYSDAEDLGVALAEALLFLGVTHFREQQRSEDSPMTAEDLFRRACQILESLWENESPHERVGNLLVFSLTSLSGFLKMTGRHKESAGFCKRAVEVGEARWRADPTDFKMSNSFAGALMGWGIQLSESGQLDEAEEAYRRAVEVCRPTWETAEVFSQVSVTVLRCLGNFLQRVGDWEEARELIRKSEEYLTLVRNRDSDSLEVGRELGTSHLMLCEMQLECGNAEEAERAFERWIRLQQDLVENYPANLSVAAEFVSSLRTLDGHPVGGSQNEGVKLILRRTIPRFNERWERNPSDSSTGTTLVLAMELLAERLTEPDELEERLEWYGCSIRILRALWQAYPERVQLGYDLSLMLMEVSDLSGDEDLAEEAERTLHRAIRLCEKNWQESGGDFSLASELLSGLERLGDMLSGNGKRKESEEVFRIACSILKELLRSDPDDIGFQIKYALVLFRSGQAEEARDFFRSVSHGFPDDPDIQEIEELIFA